MMKHYRSGAMGALMDEYERATRDLQRVLAAVDDTIYTAILDAETADEDCRSVQTIINHVVRSGYGYANYIRNQYNEDFTERKNDYGLQNAQTACAELDRMLHYTAETLENKWHFGYPEFFASKIETRWGQVFDVEQMLEHAIVHVLRHRRQIERLLQEKYGEEYISPL